MLSFSRWSAVVPAIRVRISAREGVNRKRTVKATAPLAIFSASRRTTLEADLFVARTPTATNSLDFYIPAGRRKRGTRIFSDAARRPLAGRARKHDFRGKNGYLASPAIHADFHPRTPT